MRPETHRTEHKAPKSKFAKSEEPLPLCKFAAGCTKPDCPFAHPTPAAGQEGLVLRGEMCPDGRDCLNREVLYFYLLPTNISVIWVIQVPLLKVSEEKRMRCANSSLIAPTPTVLINSTFPLLFASSNCIAQLCQCRKHFRFLANSVSTALVRIASTVTKSRFRVDIIHV